MKIILNDHRIRYSEGRDDDFVPNLGSLTLIKRIFFNKNEDRNREKNKKEDRNEDED